MSEANKALVRRLVAEVINERRFDLLDVLCEPRLARRLKRAFTEFASAFPDWRQDIIEIVVEDDQVAAHFTCSGTQRGSFMDHPPTGRRMEGVHEVFFFGVEHGRLATMWGLEDTWDRMQQLGHLS